MNVRAEAILRPEFESVLSLKENIFRFKTMPTPNGTMEGNIVQYIGDTLKDSYIHNNYYKCVKKDNLYYWVESPLLLPVLYNDYSEPNFAGYIVNEDNKYKKVYIYSYLKSQDIDTPVLVGTSPIMTSNTTPTPYVVSSSYTYSVNYADWKVFQNIADNAGTFDCWCSYGSQLPQWIKIDVGEPKIFSQVKMRPRAGGGDTMVSSFKIEASNDNETWTELTQQSVTDGSSLTTYDFTNTTAYRYYKFNVLTGFGGAGNCIIGRLQYLSYVTPRTLLNIETILDRTELYYDNTRYMIKYTRTDEDWQDLP